MDEPGHPVAAIVVAVGILVVGAVAITLVGPGERASLQIPQRIGDLQRTPSEEVSTPNDLVATYTSGQRVVLLSVTRTDAGDAPISCTANQCVVVRDGLSYTLVDNSSDTFGTKDLVEQAVSAVSDR